MINTLLLRFSQGEEPTVNSNNPNLSEIYLYKQYIIRQENVIGQLLLAVIMYFVLSIPFYLYFDALLMLPMGRFNIFSQAYQGLWENSRIFVYSSFLRVCVMSVLFPGSIFIIFYIVLLKRLKNLKDNFRQYQIIYENNLFNDLESRWNIFRQKLRALTADSARINFEDSNTYDNVSESRKKIGLLLEHQPNSYDANEIQYYLDSLQEFLKREQSEQQSQQRWRLVNIAVIIGYIMSLAWLMFVASSNDKLRDSIIPFLSIPLWAIIWGAMGSLSAILYRFYTVRKRVHFSQESQWLIARPLIGILMSAIAYLATLSGLIVLGSSSTDSTSTLPENSRRILSITCFLAGFSDRFYLSLIDLLINKAVGKESNNNEQMNNSHKEDIFNLDSEFKNVKSQSVEISLQSDGTLQGELDLFPTSKANQTDANNQDKS